MNNIKKLSVLSVISLMGLSIVNGIGEKNNQNTNNNKPKTFFSDTKCSEDEQNSDIDCDKAMQEDSDAESYDQEKHSNTVDDLCSCFQELTINDNRSYNQPNNIKLQHRKARLARRKSQNENLPTFSARKKLVFPISSSSSSSNDINTTSQTKKRTQTSNLKDPSIPKKRRINQGDNKFKARKVNLKSIKLEELEAFLGKWVIKIDGDSELDEESEFKLSLKNNNHAILRNLNDLHASYFLRWNILCKKTNNKVAYYLKLTDDDQQNISSEMKFWLNKNLLFCQSSERSNKCRYRAIYKDNKVIEIYPQTIEDLYDNETCETDETDHLEKH